MKETQSVWEAENWAVYKERYNVENFHKTTNSERIKIIDSRVGAPTVRVLSPNGKRIFLHSSVDPVKEAQKIAQSISVEAGKVIVVFGFALGYLIEALLERVDKRNPIFIIEPDPELFVAAMGSRDLRHLISSEHVYFVVGDSIPRVKGSFFVIYDEAKYNEIIMTGLMGHQTVYSDFYHQSVQRIKEVVSEKLVNLQTMIQKGPDFVSNCLLNLPEYCSRPGIASLFDCFNGMPAIIVSAGPSLNKNIHLLKEAKGKVAILAVGTAVKALRKWGIEPDFVFSIDPERINYELHFKDVDMGEAVLVAEIQSHFMILANHQGPIFVSGDMPILKWFGESIENKGRIESGGSVANNAFVAAYKMGANPIVLVGQDLAFSRDGHSHASGTSYENRVHSGGEKSQYFDVKANDGGQILTNLAFNQFRNFFQLWIEGHTDREYINATEGGAFIEGTKIMTLQKVLDQYCQKTVDIQGIIKKAQESFKLPNIEPILGKLELRLKDANKTIAEANKALKHLRQLEIACTNRQGKKMQQHLKTVNKIYKKFENDPYIREVAEAFSQRDIHGLFSRTHAAEYAEEDDFHAAIADYTIYYEKVLQGTKSVEELLHRCIKKFRRNKCNDE